MGQLNCVCGRVKPAGRGRHMCDVCSPPTSLRTPNVAPEVREEILRLHAEGMIHREIAERVHWSRATVGRVIKSSGAPERPVLHPARLREEDVFGTSEMYMAGVSIKEIARRTGMTRLQVAYRVNRAGVPRRDTAESTHLARVAAIAEGGRDALTSRQRRVLEVVEERQPVLTRDIGRRTRIPYATARGVLYTLRDLGLVSAIKQSKGKGNPLAWNRTDLAVCDVLHAALAAKRKSGKSDQTIDVAPLRDWISELIAVERRKILYDAITAPHSSEASSAGAEQAVHFRLGIGPRQVWRILNESQTITFGFADEILQHAGGPRMEDLWPELEAELEQAA